MSSAARQGGLTLVELLVSMALTGTLLLALATLVVLGQRAYLADQALARLHENGRLALRVLQRELSMAGYLGWAVPGAVQRGVTGTPCFEALLGPLPAFVHYDDLTVEGTSKAGPGIPAACRRSAYYQAGNDALLVRRAADTPSVFLGSPLLPVDEGGTYLQQEASAGLSPGADVAGGRVTAWRYQPVLLFVRNYSRTSGDGIPTLCRLRLSPGRADTAPTECLLEGLEVLQVEFGVDSDNDSRADRYVARLAADDKPLLARITVLMRATSHAGSTPLPRVFHLGPLTFTAPDGRQRLLLSTTVLLRNAGVLRG